MSKLSNPAKLARKLGRVWPHYFKVTNIYEWHCHLRDHSQKSVVCFVFFWDLFVG